MATATHGAVTATMTFCTVPQAAYCERYHVTIEVLKGQMAILVDQLNAAIITEAEYTNKIACLLDLYAQNEALWASLGPTVAWS